MPYSLNKRANALAGLGHDVFYGRQTGEVFTSIGLVVLVLQRYGRGRAGQRRKGQSRRPSLLRLR